MVSNVTTFVIENTCALVAEAAAFVDLASFGLAYSLAMGYFFAEISFWNVILEVKNSEFWDLIVNFTLVKKSVIKIPTLFKFKNHHWITNGSVLKNPEISGAIFKLNLSILILNSQCVEGAIERSRYKHDIWFIIYE